MPPRWKNRATPSSRAIHGSSASDPSGARKSFRHQSHSDIRAIMTSELPKTAVAETLAAKIAALKPGELPASTTRKCEDLLIDIVGLCVTARNEDYVRSS